MQSVYFYSGKQTLSKKKKEKQQPELCKNATRNLCPRWFLKEKP